MSTITNRRIVTEDNGGDFYPTPAWATKVLIEHEKFEGSIWEPCCGNGAMSEVLKTTGNEVFSSDLYGRGYGVTPINFLTYEFGVSKRPDNIITNPPFNLAEEMIHKALSIADKKVAFLLRLAFLESVGRYNRLYKINPPTRVWVFSERITFYPEGKQTGGSGTTAYAWFVWDQENMSQPYTDLKWFPPGFKEK